MKVAIICLALVAACSAVSLKQRILNKVESAQVKRAGGGDRKGDGEKMISVWLEYGSLVGKCEAFFYFISEMTPEEKRSEDKIVLLEMCPHVFEFGESMMKADENMKDELAMELAKYFKLMQCTNLMAEVQMLQFIGFTGDENSDMVSGLLIHGKPLFDICIEEFGNAEAEADKVENALDNTGNAPDKKSESLLNLVRQLKAALRK